MVSLVVHNFMNEANASLAIVCLTTPISELKDLTQLRNSKIRASLGFITVAFTPTQSSGHAWVRILVGCSRNLKKVSRVWRRPELSSSLMLGVVTK